MSDADRERLQAIEARLLAERRLSDEITVLQRLPVTDMVGDAEERADEIAALRDQRLGIRAHYAADVLFLLAAVRELAAENARLTAARNAAD